MARASSVVQLTLRTVPVIALLAIASPAFAQDAGPADAGDDAADGGDGGDTKVRPVTRKADENLVRLAQGLLDKGDLVQIGGSLLEEPKRPGAAKAARAPKAQPAVAAAAAIAAAIASGSVGPVVMGAGPDGKQVPGRMVRLADGQSVFVPTMATAIAAAVASGAVGPVVMGASSDGKQVPGRMVTLEGGQSVFVPLLEDGGIGDLPATESAAGTPEVDAGADAGDDAGADNAGDAGAPVAAKEDPETAPPKGLIASLFGATGKGPAAKKMPMKALAESPLAKLGVPVQAVPAMATAVTAGAMAIWPALIKTLTGLFKSFVASKLKDRAKKGQKIDDAQRTFHLFGLPLRPVEIASICFAALLYGLAACYAFQGRRLESGFVVRQELLVLAIYYSRSFVRFSYERAYRLSTQYKFWWGGSLLCLGSAYMGNTLGTVGYEVDAAKSPEDAERIVKMKAWLLCLALGMAVAFYFINHAYPAKVFQTGRLMMSGMALAEILPIAPMPGSKIVRWNKLVWVALALVTVPTFFLINYVF
jgi:hypothetical protein